LTGNEPHTAGCGVNYDRLAALNGERATHRLPPPRLGEQTTAILEELGVATEEIDALVRERVVSR